MSNIEHSPIQRAVNACGSKARLAKQIGVSAAMVWQWCSGIRPVPAKYCRAIEEATGGEVTKFELAPEVFGNPEAEGVN